MKESYWAYFLLALGVTIIIIMMMVQRMSTTTEEDFYLGREVLESSMLDAIDYGTYRTTGRIVMSKEKFVEVFIRRFSQSVVNSKTYKLSFYDIYEEPPKATVRIRTTNGATEVGNEVFDINLDTVLTGILETLYGAGNTSAESQKYKITFNNNCTSSAGGSGGPGVKEVEEGSKLPTLKSNEKPKCTNRTFQGWYTTKDGGKQYYDKSMKITNTTYTVTKDITLYGHWKRNDSTPQPEDPGPSDNPAPSAPFIKPGQGGNSGGSGGCFLAGTKVETILGKKDIDTLSAFDMALTYNEKSNKNEYARVLEVFELKNIDETLYTLTFDNNEVLKITHSHPLYIKRDNEFSYIKTQDLALGDLALFADGTLHKIVNISSKEIKQTVYNLHISDNNNFYVGDSGILVHNSEMSPTDPNSLEKQ